MHSTCLLLVAVLVGAVTAGGSSDCRDKREIRVCEVKQPDGTTLPVQYGCDQICCGGVLASRGVGTECCGNEIAGEVYDDRTQICCSFVNNVVAQFAVYNRTDDNDFCCGLSLFNQSRYSQGYSCCTGWLSLPTPFYTLTEMCCEGVVTHVGNTAFGSCCGNEGYDRRYSSCPCHRPPVLNGIDYKDAACCRSDDRSRAQGYDRRTQLCCNGDPYDDDNQMCCGGVVGDIDTQTCCNGVLIEKGAGDGAGRLGCCDLSNGDRVTFDIDTHICCNGTVQPINTTSICCGNRVYSVAVYGDLCCGDNTPYHSSTDICCNGNAGAGSACCVDLPYTPGEQICCQGKLGEYNFEWPSCCGGTPYDAYTSTCCGTRVLDNPIVPGVVPGETELSHFTRCCGNHANDETLVVYDYFHSVCCGDKVYDVGYEAFGTAQCCGDNKMDGALSVCCDDMSVQPRIYGDDTGCCGGRAYNRSNAICCSGVPRALNGVPREKAFCCGDGCIDGGLFYCCGGERYPKEGMSTEDFDRLSCDMSPPDFGAPSFDYPAGSPLAESPLPGSPAVGSAAP